MNRSFERVTFNVNFPLDADGETVPLSIGKYVSFGVYATLTYGIGEDAAGNIYLEISDDKTNWSAISTSLTAYTSSTTYLTWTRDFNPFKYIRVKVDNNSGTGGLMDVYLEGLLEEGA